MRIFLAGASGVIGRRLVPRLVAAGHVVAGTTRSPEHVGALNELGATPIVVDVYDADALRRAVVDFAPDLVMHQLTDLPDDAAAVGDAAAANARIRREGTANLLAAAAVAGVSRVIAQSVAWELPGEAGDATRELERRVLQAGGVVVRYGQFFGPGTYHAEPPPPPRIHVDEAARRTIGLLDAPSGIVVVSDR